MFGINDMLYEDWLKWFKWLILEKRRILLLFIECYKIINGLNCLNLYELFDFVDKYRLLRFSYCFKFKMKFVKLNCYKYFFFFCIVNLWNNLRKEIVEVKDLRIFRNKLVNEFF